MIKVKFLLKLNFCQFLSKICVGSLSKSLVFKFSGESGSSVVVFSFIVLGILAEARLVLGITKIVKPTKKFSKINKVFLPIFL